MKVAVACVKWGARFGPDYVNVLRAAVAERLALPHRFVCLTNQPEGIGPGVETRPVPEFGVPEVEWTKRGCWPKVALFAPGVFEDDEVVLYLDLDVLVVGDLAPFPRLLDGASAFYSLREWNPPLLRLLPIGMRPDRGSQGSVYVWRAGEQRHVFADFTSRVAEVRASFWSDRFYLPKVAANHRYLPYDWCLSFKNHCLAPWPLNLVRPEARLPAGARIIVFHGKPRPIDVMGPDGLRWGSKRRSGDRPVPWVRDYWLRHGGRLPAAPAG